MRKYIKRALPEGTIRRKIAKKVLNYVKRVKSSLTPDTIDYTSWIKKCESKTWGRLPRRAKLRPLISVVVPAFNTPERYLEPLLKSLQEQTYPKWQLCIADASTDGSSSQLIEEMSKYDERITYKKLVKNYGIAENTNQAIRLAKGTYIGFLDHDDTLATHALEEIVISLNRDPTAELLYSDEDKLSDNGRERLLPFFKPDWSPELLLGVNYITHFVVVKKSLLQKVGGLRMGYEGAQDYDLLLRLTEHCRSIVHIPKILYHWRQASGSTAKQVSEKSYATTAGQKALADALRRRHVKAGVMEVENQPTNYRPHYELPKEQPKVSIIIPFKDKVELLQQCVPSILDNTTYINYEIILISNNSAEKATAEYLKKLSKLPVCKVLQWDYPFNYSAINNFGRRHADGEYLIFLNNDTKVITPSWIEELVGVASQPEIGAVGPLLQYPNEFIQHAGVVLGMQTMAGHVFRLRHENEWTDFGLTTWPRNFLAVTGACLVVKGSNFDMIGGFDEKLRVGGNDIALCISLYEKRLRNVFWPFAELIHYENMSVGPYSESVPVEDYHRSVIYYKKYLKEGDPYFNPNLDLMNEQIAIRRIK